MSPDGLYLSVLDYWFSPDFLIQDGLAMGDSYDLTISIVFRDDSGAVQATDEEVVQIVIDDQVNLTSNIKGPSGWVQPEDIVGFNLR